ncbi:MAG: LytTR family transcriptional regulator [Bacteroidales bacterium]|nr:LytTR family transcriptional regulator [Bacteroidales bacterium]
MENQSNIIEDSRYQIKLISLISLGMLLYVLFLQPFDYNVTDFNVRLIFILGLAAITFIILLVFRIILPFSFTSRIRAESLKISNEVGLILLIWFFITAANICYIFFVGKIEISLATSVKIALFSSFPSVILKIADVNMSLRNQLRHFVRRNLKLEHDLLNSESKVKDPILFQSDTQTDKVEILPDNVMLVRSADNYVEIYYRKGQYVERKLIRNTLKNIQIQLHNYSEFLRCHRTCIVNSSYILNMTNSYKGHRLEILDMEEEEIPVSRQYILAIKEVLDAE